MSRKQELAKPEVKIFLDRNMTNSILSVLSKFAALDNENKFSGYAEKVKETILTHGRKLTRKEEESASLFLYADEAATLIKLLAIYIGAIDDTPQDYFSEIGKKRKERT